MYPTAAAMTTSATQTGSSKRVENKPAAGIQDLFKESPVLTLSSSPAKSQANVKSDIMSLFEKVTYVFCIYYFRILFICFCIREFLIHLHAAWLV